MSISTETKSFNVDLALYITVPLGYYVGWLEWLAWINVAVVWIMMIVGLIIMIINQDGLMVRYREKGITPPVQSWNPFKAGNIRSIALITLLFVFGWNIVGWTLASAMVAFKLLSQDIHKQLSS